MLTCFWHGLLINIRQINKILIASLIVSLGSQFIVVGQSRIDSLRTAVDSIEFSDPAYVRSCIEICKISANTDDEYLIPIYANLGLEADTLGKDYQSKFTLYTYLGNYYWQTGRLSEAAEQFNAMRLIGETRNDDIIIANSFNGLGTVYYLMNSFEEALDYYRKGLELSGNDTLLKVRLYNNIANSFVSQDQMDSVLPYYHKSIAYHQAHQNYRFLSIVYMNVALVHDKLKNESEVKRYAELAMETAVKSKDPYQLADVYENQGYLLVYKNPRKALPYFLKALDIARESKSYNQIKLGMENLAYTYGQTGDLKKANDFLWALKSLDDSLNLVQRKTRLQQLEFEHISELRKIEQAEKSRLNELKELRDKNRQRNLLIIVSGGFIALLVVLLMLYQVYRLKVRISSTKDRFFSMIAHDIRNPFSGILGLSEVLSEDARKFNDPVHQRQLESLNKSLTHVYDLLDNLLQWSQSETGKIAFKPQFQLLTPIVEEVVHLHLASAKQKSITIENHVQFGITAHCDSNMLHTVLRNLLSNAIKFSPEKSTITITAKSQGKEVLVSVRDQGMGMTGDQVNRIFKSEQRFSTPGTRNETGTGLGLVLCKNFITAHKGKIWVESKIKEGTTIYFTLPD